MNLEEKGVWRERGTEWIRYRAWIRKAESEGDESFSATSFTLLFMGVSFKERGKAQVL